MKALSSPRVVRWNSKLRYRLFNSKKVFSNPPPEYFLTFYFRKLERKEKISTKEKYVCLGKGMRSEEIPVPPPTESASFSLSSSASPVSSFDVLGRRGLGGIGGISNARFVGDYEKGYSLRVCFLE
ncbi:hypothetical protein CEXT_89011 [Caerostris extrusa]|uniref:Uncharacterized protein n=1 Tax=Caerostris extrusa TaxID=172846 RepID=A0AAV4T3N6_CAEEX|nr:hypothetical protein CEXT_89011 [Caerostris extrusa]